MQYLSTIQLQQDEVFTLIAHMKRRNGSCQVAHLSGGDSHSNRSAQVHHTQYGASMKVKVALSSFLDCIRFYTGSDSVYGLIVQSLKHAPCCGLQIKLMFKEGKPPLYSLCIVDHLHHTILRGSIRYFSCSGTASYHSGNIRSTSV